MADTRTDELYRALQDKGYPDELCREIAYKHMNTDYTATRMLGYLYRVTSPRVDDVIDEMLAILSNHPEERAGTCPGYDQQCVQGWAVRQS